MKRNWTYKAKFHHDPYMFLILNGDGIVIAELSGENFTIDKAKAHAKLIAAAPELLAACKEGKLRIAFLLRKIVDSKAAPVVDSIDIRKTAVCIDFLQAAIADAV